MPHHAPFSIVTVAILALIAWRIYARIRRNIGRQRFRPARSWLSVTLFPVVLLLVAFGLRFQPQVMGLSLAAGVAAGVALGFLGLRLTRFEVAGNELFYVPSAHLGITLSALFVGRLVYRFMTVGLPGTDQGSSALATHMTPLTLLLIGTLGGYYVTYAVGLLRWSRQHRGLQPTGMPT